MPTHYLKPKNEDKGPQDPICLFAQTNFRNQVRRFGIKLDDRRRHMYIVGKTGMGKTTLMENMVLHDIYAGRGVGVVDPHGDFAEKIIDYIPSNRINDVIYFNPSDVNNPIGFNILEVKNEEQKHLVAAGLMGIFKKIWPDVWSSRMEYILNNTLLALLDFPGSTLLGINRLLGDKKFRKKVVRNLKDPVIKSFWQNEFANYNDRYQQEAVAPIQNKIGQFLSASVIRNMVAQVKSTINIRQAMDTSKILIMNLSKGRIGEDNSRLLGGMLITQIQLAAMERVDTLEEDRKDFFLFVDEFQNFATPSFANILSEARKYRLGLIMAHQYVAQLDEVVADAVFGNVGTLVTFRVGGADAEFLVKEFSPVFMEEDIVNLAKFNIFLKLMIDGVASMPFSATSLPPIGSPTGSREKVIKVSRERYSKDRASIEDKILRWSGLEGTDDAEEDDSEEKVESDKKRPKPAATFPKNLSKKESSGSEEKKKPTKEEKTPALSPKKDHKEKRIEKVSEKKKDRKEEPRRPKPSVVAPPKEVDNNISGEKTLSLRDLMPKTDDRQKPKPISTLDLTEKPEQGKKEPDLDNLNPSQPRKEEHVKKQQEVSKSSDGDNISLEEPKKKRKRKRKRKKKSGNRESDSQQSQNNVVQKQEEKKEQPPKVVPDAHPQPIPKAIDQNQIITFD